MNMKSNKIRLSALFMAVVMCFANYSFACTNFLITKGASKDGSTMVTYAADCMENFITIELLNIQKEQ